MRTIKVNPKLTSRIVKQPDIEELIKNNKLDKQQSKTVETVLEILEKAKVIEIRE